jgi:hypothetical protein
MILVRLIKNKQWKNPASHLFSYNQSLSECIFTTMGLLPKQVFPEHVLKQRHITMVGGDFWGTKESGKK